MTGLDGGLPAPRRATAQIGNTLAPHVHAGGQDALRRRGGGAADRQTLARLRPVPPRTRGGCGENYSIAVPPPNVTGALHMGHALNGTIQDVLIRLHRMRGGKRAVDARHRPRRHRHAEQVESASCADEGTSRAGARPRGASCERVWEWRERVRRRRSSSSSSASAPRCDYADERFTMDDALRTRRAERSSSRLYEKGFIYRDDYLVNWEPGLQLGDLRPRGGAPEVERHALLRRVPGRGRRRRSTVATVRPETMLADTAVAVHPDDERYRDLIGKTAIAAARRAAGCRSSPTTTSSRTSAPAR